VDLVIKSGLEQWTKDYIKARARSSIPSRALGSVWSGFNDIAKVCPHCGNNPLKRLRGGNGGKSSQPE